MIPSFFHKSGEKDLCNERKSCIVSRITSNYQHYCKNGWIWQTYNDVSTKKERERGGRVVSYKYKALRISLGKQCKEERKVWQKAESLLEQVQKGVGNNLHSYVRAFHQLKTHSSSPYLSFRDRNFNRKNFYRSILEKIYRYGTSREIKWKVYTR